MIGRQGIKKIRGNVIKTLKAWSGKLLEPKYTKNISSSIIKDEIFKMEPHQIFEKQN